MAYTLAAAGVLSYFHGPSAVLKFIFLDLLWFVIGALVWEHGFTTEGITPLRSHIVCIYIHSFRRKWLPVLPSISVNDI